MNNYKVTRVGDVLDIAPVSGDKDAVMVWGATQIAFVGLIEDLSDFIYNRGSKRWEFTDKDGHLCILRASYDTIELPSAMKGSTFDEYDLTVLVQRNGIFKIERTHDE
jgi:hypothetical protein